MLKWDEGKFNVHTAKTSVGVLAAWSSFDYFYASVFGRRIVSGENPDDPIRYPDLKAAKRAAVQTANAFLAKAVKELAMVEIEP